VLDAEKICRSVRRGSRSPSASIVPESAPAPDPDEPQVWSQSYVAGRLKLHAGSEVKMRSRATWSDADADGAPQPHFHRAESMTVPLDDSVRLDRHHRVQTARPYSVEPNPEQPVDREQPGPTRPLVSKNMQLMTQGQVL
jgi:hypothetical protein